MLSFCYRSSSSFAYEQRLRCSSVPWLCGTDRTCVMPQQIKFRDYYFILELTLVFVELMSGNAFSDRKVLIEIRFQ